MAIPYEPLVKEDLNLGIGTVSVTMPAGGTATGTKVGLHTFSDVYYARDYGLLADNASDNTPAFNAMVASLAALGGAPTVVFGPGIYKFKSRPNAIPIGLMLRGNGSTGSTTGYGTTLLADYSENTATNGFLTWDGSLSAGFTAGGGAEDLILCRSSSFSGGTAIVLKGANDNHRASYSKFDRLVILTNGSSTWNRGILIDGTGLTTSGTKGVRETRILNCVIASCSDTDANIYLYNAVHVYVFGVHCTPTAANTCGITVTGPAGSPSTNIFFGQSNVDGNVSLDLVTDFVYCGRIGANFTCTANSNNVSAFGGIHGTIDVAHSATVQLFLDSGTYLQQLIPIFDVTFPALSGIFTLPRVPGQGADLLRASAISGATGVPLGFSATPATGGSGAPYLGFNQNQDTGDNNATYYRAGYPAFRIGNPLGNGTYALWDYVAPAGANAGDAVSYVISRKVHGTTGVQEFPQGIVAGDSSGKAFSFTILTASSVIDPGAIADGAVATTNQTVSGAVLGDTALATFTGITASKWILHAEVIDNSGTVAVAFLNKTGGSVDLPSGTLRVDVIHHL